MGFPLCLEKYKEDAKKSGVITNQQVCFCVIFCKMISILLKFLPFDINGLFVLNRMMMMINVRKE